jgi:hypothetical protein
MSNETGIQVDDATLKPDIQLQETTKPQKYTPEEFYADLKKVQDQAEQEVAPEPELEEAPAAHEVELPAESEKSPWEDEEEEQFKGPIPKKRLNKEIERRKAIEQELMHERENRIKYETELNLYNKALEQLQAKNQAPEQEVEPIDADAHNLYMKKIGELEKRLETQSQNFSYSQSQIQAQNLYAQQESKFVAKHPDYKDAIDHIVKTEINNYTMTGIDRKEAEKITSERIMGLAAKALEVGKDVPEIMYNLAKNYGYNAQKATKTGPNLSNIEKNIKKSETILNDVPEITTTFAPEAAQYTNFEGFQRLMNSNGRGVNPNEFHKILAKVREGR